MNKQILFVGALLLLQLNASTSMANKAKPKSSNTSKLSPARLYEKQVESISKDWLDAAKKYYAVFYQFDQETPIEEKKILIPQILKLMPELRKQSRRFGTVSPVPLSMRSVDEKYTKLSKVMDELLDLQKSWLYSGSMSELEQISAKHHLSIDLMEAAKKEMDRILGTTSNPKKYVPG